MRAAPFTLLEVGLYPVSAFSCVRVFLLNSQAWPPSQVVEPSKVSALGAPCHVRTRTKGDGKGGQEPKGPCVTLSSI